MSTAPLRKLSRPNMEALAAALDSGRLAPPFSQTDLQPFIASPDVAIVAAELSTLTNQGMKPGHIAYLLRVLASERHSTQLSTDAVELVWTGEDIPGTTSRDTSVVVHELFASARKSVLVASYAFDRDEKAHNLFGQLASRFDHEAQLSIRLYVNIHRPVHNFAPQEQLVAEFSTLFRNHIWPGKRLPQVFYDPRALQIGGTQRACLHAKCIVIDEIKAFITSANFTEAAHQRNIEAGVLLSEPTIAISLSRQFETLTKLSLLKALKFE